MKLCHNSSIGPLIIYFVLELITDKARNLFISRSCSRPVSIGRECSIQYFLNRSSMGKDIAVSIIFAFLSCLLSLTWFVIFYITYEIDKYAFFTLSLNV